MAVSIIEMILAMPTTPVEMIHVVRKVAYTKPNGSEGFSETPIGDFKVSPQPLGTLNKVEGLTLQSSLAGNKLNSVFGLYGINMGYKEGDIIIRPDGLKYELKTIEPQGVGTPMEHVKLLVVKVDNQNEQLD